VPIAILSAPVAPPYEQDWRIRSVTIESGLIERI